jgi:hypothetical protein
MARIARTVLATALVAGGGALLVAGVLALSRGDEAQDRHAPGIAAGTTDAPRAAADEAALNATVTATELTELAEAMRQHVPQQATVLAWWDTSRQLQRLAGTPVRFGEDAANATPATPASAGPDFDAYQSALLSTGGEGLTQLRRLADGRDAYLVLHVRDLLLLGALHPDRLGVAFVDLPDTGNLHGSIHQARYWARDMGYPAYTAYRIADLRPRVVALTDQASLGTLIGRLLPFHDPHELRQAVEGLTLVHQTGGFWVFRLDQG